MLVDRVTRLLATLFCCANSSSTLGTAVAAEFLILPLLRLVARVFFAGGCLTVALLVAGLLFDFCARLLVAVGMDSSGKLGFALV